MPIHIELERLDAHPADVHGLRGSVDVPGDLLLSQVLTRVLEPFLERTPRATWVCRATWSGRRRDIAEVLVAYGAAEHLRSRLLVEDEPLGAFLGPGESAVGLSCRPLDPS
ncbi:hypothetical protein [Pseudactinotalea terrae]|uniref:hypothetical protein n=1 Tax=Pseudactinotalea terrae TaxID=1743262 RepID=UPI0012E2DE2A|nr:hypothetical protein [Pseudactinotalea terrae]